MKKVLAAILFAIAALLPAFSQEIPDSVMVTSTVAQELPLVVEDQPAMVKEYKKNELSVALTLGTGLQALVFIDSSLGSLVRTIVNDNLTITIPFVIPGLTIEYDRWITDRVAVGAILYADIVSELPAGIMGNVSLLADAKYRWIDKGTLKFYSKIALGINSAPYAYKEEDGKWSYGNYSFAHEDEKNSTMAALFPVFAWQVMPVGLDIRTAVKNLDFFFELGFGTQGILALGLKKAF